MPDPDGRRPYIHTTRRGGPSRHGKINFLDDEPAHHHKPLGGHYFKAPVMRQYLHQGIIWRERAEREPSRFELFFDLIFVAILQQLGHGATEVFSGLSVGIFIVLFFPSWAVWHDLRIFINRSGTDDIPQRIYILLVMCLLLGYIANASALSHSAVAPSESHGEEHPLPSLRATILFYIIARALSIIQNIIYAFALPKFAKTQLAQAAGTLAQIALCFPLIWVHSQPTVWIILGMGVVLDLLLRLSAILALLAHRLGVAPRTHASHVPALNIEHHIERESQFVIIVLGEALLNLTYSAVPPNVGVTPQFGRSILGLMATYLFGWLYFEQDVSHTFVHALRRHWFSAFASVYVHFPLSAGLILWSASLHQLVDHETVSKGVQWYLAGGLSVSLLCLAVIGWLHKSMDAKGSSLIPRNVLIVLRVTAAITCVLLPLSDNLNDSVHILSIHVSILIALVVLDAVGKFGAMPDSSLSTGHDVASSSQGNNTAEEQGQAGDQNQGQLDRILSSETVNATTEKQPEVVEKLESAVVV